METTKLIQRCTKPLHSPMGIRNPFAFGAGGGRLSDKALELLAPVLNFDYMMAAEYEFGAVPEGLNKIREGAEAKLLFFSTLDIKVKSVKLKSDGTPRKDESVKVYVIGPSYDRQEIERRITLLATDEDRCMSDMWQHFVKKGGLHEGMYVRDSPLLNRYIKYVPTSDRPIVGWLELNNGFFFSVDKEMAESFAKLFGLSPNP